MSFFKKMFLGITTLGMSLYLNAANNPLAHQMTNEVDSGMVFYHQCDDNCKAKRSCGSLNPDRISKKCTFGYGIKEKALRIGANSKGKENGNVIFSGSNLSLEKGSIAFWIKPEDWDGTNPHFQLFVGARGSGKSVLQIYNYQNRKGLSFYLSEEGKKGNIRANIAHWHPSEWHHIVAVWNSKEMLLYMDGRLASSGKRPPFKRNKIAKLIIGSARWSNERGYSLIDEIKIYNRPLTPDEIKKDFIKLAPANSGGKCKLCCGKTQHPPIIDGIIDKNEYAFGSGVFFGKHGSVPSDKARWCINYDDKFLYLAMQTAGEKLRNVARVRDGKLWLDDSVEFWLGSNQNEIYQFIFNASGTLFDCKRSPGIDATWNIKGYKIKSRVKDGVWTFEFAVPWNAINYQPNSATPLLLNCCRTFVQRPHTMSMSQIHGYADSYNFTRVYFDGQAPCWELVGLGNLAEGNLALHARFPKCKKNTKFKIAYTLKNGLPVFDKILSCSGTNVKYTHSKLAPDGILSIKATSNNLSIMESVYTLLPANTTDVEYIYTDIAKQQLCSVIKSSMSGGSMLLSLKKRNDSKIFKRNVKLEKGQAFLTDKWDISEIPAGLYEYEACYKDASGNISKHKYKVLYHRYCKKAPWDDNEIGVYPGYVPPPWSPIQAKGDMVKLKMQSYNFINNLLPSSIIAGKREILNRPCEIIINGKVVSDAVTKPKLGKIALDRVIRQANATVGSCDISSRVSIDYDGLMSFDIDFNTGSKPFLIKTLYIDIPLKNSIAEQVHSCEDIHTRKFGISKMLGKTQWHKNLYVKPAFWVGNDDAGVIWCAENLKNWRNNDRTHTVRIIPGEKEKIVRLQLIDKKTWIKGSHTFKFFLQGTPSRPLNPNRRSYFKPKTFHRLWTFASYYFNYLNPDYLSHNYFKRWNRIRNAGTYGGAKKFMFYLGSNGASPRSPEWGYWGKLWTGRPLDRWVVEGNYRTNKQKDQGLWTYGCLNCKSFKEFMLWQYKNIVDHPLWENDALYYDLVGPRMCSNSEHGCGWKDENNNVLPTCNIYGGRDFHKRIYQLQKKRNPHFWNAYHVTGQPGMSPLNSFADELVCGESFFNGLLSPIRRSYIGIFTPERFRIMYSGRKWGVHMAFVNMLCRCDQNFAKTKAKDWKNLKSPKPEIIKACRHILGYCLVHDVHCLAEREKFLIKEDREIFTKMYKFLGGWDAKIKFIPYWKSKSFFKLFSSQPKKVVASAYIRNNRAMIVILNDTFEKQNIKLSINAKKMLNIDRGCLNILFQKQGKQKLELNSPLKDVIPPHDFKVYFVGGELSKSK